MDSNLAKIREALRATTADMLQAVLNDTQDGIEKLLDADPELDPTDPEYKAHCILRQEIVAEGNSRGLNLKLAEVTR